MENNIKIPTNDGHLIYGSLLSKNKERSKGLVIFVHGLSDNKDFRLIYNGAHFFKKKGFDTYRFNLYSDDPKARILENCSISTFIEDINSVFSYFRDKYKKIYLVCHSLGFVVLDCDLSIISKIVFWDPSLALKENRIESLRYEPKIDHYFINWGISFIISKQLKTEWENINDERLVKKLRVPLCLLMAEKSDLKIGWKENLKYLKAGYVYKEIQGASHTFWEEGSEDKIFKESLKWIWNN